MDWSGGVGGNISSGKFLFIYFNLTSKSQNMILVHISKSVNE